MISRKEVATTGGTEFASRSAAAGWLARKARRLRIDAVADGEREPDGEPFFGVDLEGLAGLFTERRLIDLIADVEEVLLSTSGKTKWETGIERSGDGTRELADAHSGHAGRHDFNSNSKQQRRERDGGETGGAAPIDDRRRIHRMIGRKLRGAHVDAQQIERHQCGRSREQSETGEFEQVLDGEHFRFSSCEARWPRFTDACLAIARPVRETGNWRRFGGGFP